MAYTERFSQSDADEFEERAREELGFYPGHDEGCPMRTTTPFTASQCGCGPREQSDTLNDKEEA